MSNNTFTAAGQRAAILSHLKANDTLTTQEGRDVLGVMHPAGRVLELRRMGVNIVTNWTTDYTQDGTPHRVAKYVLQSGKYKEAA